MQISSFWQARYFFRLLCFVVCLLIVTAGIGGCSGRTGWETAAGEDAVASDTVSVQGRPTEQTKSSEPAPETEAPITVHVCGAVLYPGVYQLPEGSRIVDAVDAAGGFAPEADTVRCNQAKRLTDEEQIRIFTKEETAAGGEMENTAEKDGLININTATSAQLQTLPGIGESRAETIIAFREEHGGFSSIEEIMKINGIKTAVFDKIKDLITV